MKTDNVLYWIIYFIVTILVAWIALSLILLWFRPALYNANGSVNWWTTLWVAALVIIFAWIIMVILTFIIKLFAGWGTCAKPCADPCPKPCPDPKPDPCPKPCPDPCADAGYNGPFEPRMWLN